MDFHMQKNSRANLQMKQVNLFLIFQKPLFISVEQILAKISCQDRHIVANTLAGNIPGYWPPLSSYFEMKSPWEYLEAAS